MADTLREAIQKIWADVKESEDAAWGRLRRQFPAANRTQFHDAFLEVESENLTAAEKFGADSKSVAEASRLSGMRDASTTINPGDVVSEPPASTLGEGSPTSPGTFSEEATEGLGSRTDHSDNENE
jgi:hypothetical protein